MFPVGEHLILTGQVGPAGVDQINAGQTILFGDSLGPEVFFDRNRVVGASLHCGIVDNYYARSSVDLADTCDNAPARHFVFV